MIEETQNTEKTFLELSGGELLAYEAHNIAQRIAFREKNIQKMFLEHGRDLIAMCEFVSVSPTEKIQRFKLLGYDTFETFVASPNINVGIRSAHLYKSIVQKFSNELNVPDDDLIEVGVKKLGLLWYHVDAQNVDEWVLFAQENSHSSILDEIDSRLRGEHALNPNYERPFSKKLQIDYSEDPLLNANRVINYLVNEFLTVKPEIAETESFKTAVEFMQKTFVPEK